MGWDGELMLAKEGQLVPIPALKNDFIVGDMKEAATPKSERVAPFKDGPLAVFEYVLHEANHFNRLERVGEHSENGFTTDNRQVSHLMVDGLVGIERSDGNGVRSIEGLDPSSDDFFGCHGSTLLSLTSKTHRLLPLSFDSLRDAWTGLPKTVSKASFW